MFVLALPIFPCSHPQSIVGADVLNFCVRDGNRWTHIAINTNLYGWVLPIIYVKSRRLLTAWIIALKVPLVNTYFKELVTHTGFEPMLTA